MRPYYVDVAVSGRKLDALIMKLIVWSARYARTSVAGMVLLETAVVCEADSIVRALPQVDDSQARQPADEQ
jgi:hypothetical protein